MDMLKKSMEVWINEAEANGAAHLIVVRDELLECNSPIFVFPEQDLREEVKKAGGQGPVVAICTLGGGYVPFAQPLLVSRIEN